MLNRAELRRRANARAAANNARRRAVYASPAAVAKRKANANAANKQRRTMRWVELVQTVKKGNRRRFAELFQAYKSNFPVYAFPTNAWFSIERALKVNANANAAKQKANANARRNAGGRAYSYLTSAGLPMPHLVAAVRNQRLNNFARIYNGSKSMFLAYGWPRQAVYNLAQQQAKNVPRDQPLPPRPIPPLQPLPPRPTLGRRPPYVTPGKNFGYNFVPGSNRKSLYKLKKAGSNVWIPVRNGRMYSLEEVQRLPNIYLSNEEIRKLGLRNENWFRKR